MPIQVNHTTRRKLVGAAFILIITSIIVGCGGGPTDPEDTEARPTGYDITFLDSLDRCGNPVPQDIAVTILDTNGDSTEYPIPYSGQEETFTIPESNIIGKTMIVDTLLNDITIIDIPNENTIGFYVNIQQPESCECPSYNIFFQNIASPSRSATLFVGAIPQLPGEEDDNETIWRNVEICSSQEDIVYVVDQESGAYTPIEFDDVNIFVSSLSSLDDTNFSTQVPEHISPSSTPYSIFRHAVFFSSNQNGRIAGQFSVTQRNIEEPLALPNTNDSSEVIVITRAPTVQMSHDNNSNIFTLQNNSSDGNYVYESMRFRTAVGQPIFPSESDFFVTHELNLTANANELSVVTVPSQQFDYVTINQGGFIDDTYLRRETFLPISQGVINLEPYFRSLTYLDEELNNPTITLNKLNNIDTYEDSLANYFSRGNRNTFYQETRIYTSTAIDIQ